VVAITVVAAAVATGNIPHAWRSALKVFPPGN